MIVHPNEIMTNRKLNNRVQKLVYTADDTLWPECEAPDERQIAKLWKKWDKNAQTLKVADPSISNRFQAVLQRSQFSSIKFLASYFALHLSHDGSLSSRLAATEFSRAANQLLRGPAPHELLPVLDEMEKSLLATKGTEPTNRRYTFAETALHGCLLGRMEALAGIDPLKAMDEIHFRVVGDQHRILAGGFGVPVNLAHNLIPVFTTASDYVVNNAFLPRHMMDSLSHLTWAGLYSLGVKTRKAIKDNWKKSLVNLNRHAAVSGWQGLSEAATTAASALNDHKYPFDSSFAKGVVELHRQVAVVPNAEKGEVLASLVQQAKL